MAFVAAVVVLALPAMAGAATWTSGAPHGVDDAVIAPHPTDPQTAYLLSHGTVFATHDRGLHWVRRGRAPFVSRLTAFAGPPTLLVAIDEDGTVERSLDEGLTWTRLGCCADGVDPLDPDRLVGLDLEGDLQRSTDGGATWQPMPSPPLPVGSGFFPEFAGGGVVFASTGTGAVYRSADLGSTWTLATGVPIGFIGGVSDDPLRFWIGRFRTVDGGGTWSASGPPGEACVAPSVAFHEPLRPWVMGCNGAYRSADGGDTWSALPDFGSSTVQQLGGDVTVLADGLAAFVTGALATGPWLLEQGGLVYRAGGLPPVTFGALLADPTDPSRAFSSSFTTRDGGLTWVPEPVRGRFGMARVGDRLLAVTDGVTSQPAGGGPVTTVATDATAVVADPGGGRAWVFAGHDILTTSDGLHFRRLHNSFPARLSPLGAFGPAGAGGHGRTLVVGDVLRRSGLAISRDAGRTFHLRRVPAVPERIVVDAVDGRLLAVTDVGGGCFGRAMAAVASGSPCAASPPSPSTRLAADTGTRRAARGST